MTQTWQLHEAKNRFSQVVDDATTKGPQFITRRGVEVAVVLAAETYRTRVAPEKKLSIFFQESPLVGADLDLRRDSSPAGREPGL